MNRKKLILTFVLLLSAMFIFTASKMRMFRANKVGQTEFIKMKKVDLKDNPKGKKLAVIYKGTEVKIIEDQGNWYKVELTGYISSEAFKKNRSFNRIINKH